VLEFSTCSIKVIFCAGAAFNLQPLVFRIQPLLPPFLVPQGQFQKHLHTLAHLAKLLHKQDFPDARTEMETVVIRAFHF
jgi:hypothetical protein